MILINKNGSYLFNFEHPTYRRYLQELSKKYNRVIRHERHSALLHSLGNIREENCLVSVNYQEPNKDASSMDIIFTFDGQNWLYQKIE